LLIVTPFLAAMIATGLVRLWQVESRAGIALRRGVVPLIALVWLAPPLFQLDEGPRSAIGRLYSPWAWGDWQAHMEADLATIRGAIAAPGDKVRAIVTYQWTIDRLTHQELEDAGWRLAPPVGLGPDCPVIAEIFHRGAQEIAHIRVRQLFLKEGVLLDRARFETLALPCLTLLAPEHIVALSFGPPGQADEPPSAIVATTLDEAGLRRLGAVFAQQEAAEKLDYAHYGQSYLSLEQALAATRAILPVPGPE
jgi:hypothetical protein